MHDTGGTGSGLGSYFTETLRDSFGATSLFNFAVWPHAAGEVAVQSFNGLLTLSKLTGKS
jgi:tubulin delta